jgi:hypothetical protein
MSAWRASEVNLIICLEEKAPRAGKNAGLTHEPFSPIVEPVEKVCKFAKQ